MGWSSMGKCWLLEIMSGYMLWIVLKKILLACSEKCTSLQIGMCYWRNRSTGTSDRGGGMNLGYYSYTIAAANSVKLCALKITINIYSIPLQSNFLWWDPWSLSVEWVQWSSNFLPAIKIVIMKGMGDSMFKCFTSKPHYHTRDTSNLNGKNPSHPFN